MYMYLLLHRVSGSGHSASVCMDTIDQVAPIKTSYKDSRMYSQNRKQHVDMFDEYGLGDTSSSRYIRVHVHVYTCTCIVQTL